MDNQQTFTYEIYNGVKMKPGVEIYVCDRDHPNWDRDGKILSVSKRDGAYEYEVDFGQTASVLVMESSQICPVDINTEEAVKWRMERTLRIFLCHASEDKEQVREIYEELKKAQMRPWLDEEDIAFGKDWDTEIIKAIKECHIVLVLLSSSAVSKQGYIQKELKFALDRADEMPEGTVFIIPVRLDNCAFPERIKKWQWVDIFKPNAKEKLFKMLKTYSEKIALS